MDIQFHHENTDIYFVEKKNIEISWALVFLVVVF